MTLFVVIAAVIGAATWWFAVVLIDEDLYVRSVGPLAHSPRFAALGARSVSWATRRRLRDSHLPAPAIARRLSGLVRRSMSTRAFAATWPGANRLLHRGHRNRRLPGSCAQVATSMVLLATMGIVVGACHRLTRPSGNDLRAERRW